MAGFALSDGQRASFADDGFVVVPRIVPPAVAARLRARFEPLFRGEFETGLQPDEWNWREGRDSADLTRQICNGWKADRAIAATALSAEIGAACAALSGWPGARLAQDNLLWKPPGGKSLGFHQDASYLDWIVPPEMTSCWIALDDTARDAGTVHYARGSHRWAVSPPPAAFHAPEDPLAALHDAAVGAGAGARVGAGEAVDLVPVEVAAGGGAFHHGRTWHGSPAEAAGIGRRSLVVHCVSSEARFHERNVGAIYGRYKRAGETAMEESFFPILWTASGHRSSFVSDYLAHGWGGLRSAGRPVPFGREPL